VNHKVGDLVYYDRHGLGIITKIRSITEVKDMVDASLRGYLNECPYQVEWVGNGGMIQHFTEQEITGLKVQLDTYEQASSR
jgi:hypothetical protein